MGTEGERERQNRRDGETTEAILSRSEAMVNEFESLLAESEMLLNELRRKT